MCAGVLLLAISDALTKWLVARYGPFQILLVRSLTALPFVVALVVWINGRTRLRSASPMWAAAGGRWGPEWTSSAS